MVLPRGGVAVEDAGGAVVGGQQDVGGGGGGGGEGGGGAVGGDRRQVVGGVGAAVSGAVHAGRAYRHARHGQTQGLGPLAQQGAHVAGGHMAFHQVAVDQGGVA